jgi:hypothetical protein
VLSLACVAEGLLAGLAGDGILRLNLATGRWQPSSTGLNGRLIVHFGWSSQAEALLTADLEDGVRRSIDGGRTWDMVDCAPHAASRVAFAGGVVYAATTTGLYATDDDGLTWTAVYAEAGACAVATAPTGPALAAFENAQVVLFDGGQRRCLDWDASRGRIVAVAISDAENLFIGTLGEHSILWRSADAGRSWAAWLRTDRAESMCLAVSPDFAMDEQVLVGLETRVYRPLRHTRERTRSAVRPLWSATSLRESVTSLAFGQRPSIVYAATSQGVQRSVDGADHFSAWSEGLPADVPVLAVQRTPHGVYALGFGGTLWRRSGQAPDV